MHDRVEFAPIDDSERFWRARSAQDDGVEKLIAELSVRGGVARAPVLTDLGITRGERERALSSGAVIRPGRGWLALRDADPLLISAARTGVVLTCATQARRLGLWVFTEDRPHVGARPNSGRAPTSTATVHWCAPAVPRHPDSLVDPLENVLVIVARCLPFEQALAVWESALRREPSTGALMSRLALPPAARRLLAEADPFADSGLETFVVPRLRWMNLPLRRQIWVQGHRVDLLIGDRVVLQIDGAHHTGAQRDQDIAHDRALMLLGYHVIRVSYRQIVDDWASIQSDIMGAVAQGLHRAG